MKYFVFLVIEDREILNLLLWLRTIFIGRESPTPIHVTLRGPYKKMVPETRILEWEQVIREEPLFLTNVSSFDNPKSHVVYVEVVNSRIPKVWWKPDYPVKKYGRNSHITVYDGADNLRAGKIAEFLKSESLALRCDDFRLRCHASKMAGLFDGVQRLSSESDFQGLVNLGKVKFDILERAMDAIEDYAYETTIPRHHNPYQ